ncbi:PASTA domain-containing protein [Maritalea porphyrae]|uniref:PASTA domain-containing protein n=1 Tax=Maritalea porphyrae TaxID=880732 RepID=A0ABQ5UVX6_9HYPH|nr:PASTA domain-containing protein [Maritalea porphyrae]GLQ19044.1 hypothetical protein GCM10007879_32930 [Maritalea porphyrae]
MHRALFPILLLFLVQISSGFAADPIVSYKGCEGAGVTNIVPNLVGLTVDEANKRAISCGFFGVETVGYVDDSYRVGYDRVGAQWPRGGVPNGTWTKSKWLHIYVSKGKIIPSVVGMMQQEAMEVLGNYLISIDVELTASSEPVGEVIAQSPIGGDIVITSTPIVKLLVSGGQ